jgi:riboflavin synthase
MFTGLVETTGGVKDISPAGMGARLVIAADLAAELSVGESVAVDGVCLTVVERGSDWWAADLSPTTTAVTTLGQLRPGQRVNLERPLRLGDRVGGHLVTGHVDHVGTVRGRTDLGDARQIWFTVPESGRVFLVERGSIAVAGVSLTIVAVDGEGFSVTLIPQTLTVTTLSHLAPGHPVNIEYDVMAKYLRRWAAPWLDRVEADKEVAHDARDYCPPR